MYGCFAYMNVCASPVRPVGAKPREGVRSPLTGVTDGGEPPCGC